MKLVKKGENYYALDDNTVIVGKTDDSILVHKPLSTKKLSIKNCQTIELGYDLDALAEKEFPLIDTEWCKTGACEEENLQLLGHRKTYIKAFQKALEILGDKKFTEDDVNLAFVLGKNKDESRILKLITSRIQPNTWDVEICTLNDCQGDFKKCNDANFDCILCTDIGIPKLDDDGCLILKRI